MKLTFFLGLTLMLNFQWSSSNEINSTSLVTRLSNKPKYVPIMQKELQSSMNERKSSATDTTLISKARFMEIIGKRLQSLWAKLKAEENSDSFIGRCFGVGRKLKFAMPLILFALGAIVTILGFLTLFSLKTLALLGLLVLLNVSGAASKLAVAFSGKHGESKSWQRPQNVHLHVHQNKDGNYDFDHTGGGWEDKIDKYGSSEDLDNLDTTSLYNKIYLNNLLLRNNGYVNR